MGELLDAMDSRELAEWMAFDRLEPIGSQREDLNAAMIAATIANSNRAKGQPAKVEDFIPDYEGQIAGVKNNRLLNRLEAFLNAGVK